MPTMKVWWLLSVVLVTFIVIFATISVSQAAERAKKLEAEQAKGLLGGIGRPKE